MARPVTTLMIVPRTAFLLAALLGGSTLVPAATAVAEVERELVIPRVDRAPRLDEFLDMDVPPEWAGRLAEIDRFTQRDPEDGRPASQDTRVLLGYDDERLYAVFLAYDREPELIRAQYARRETVFDDEIVEIQLDTFNGEQRAFTFICNPFGVQFDAIWREGQGFDSSWDTVWESEGRLTSRGYVVLMEIPFRSLRFPPGDVQTWRILLVRDIPRNNESSFWPPVTTRVESRLAQAGTLRGLEGLRRGRNAQIIPYGTAATFRTLDRRDAAYDDEPFDGEVGADAKLVIQDRIAVDFTANPDFSQVESDEPQVTVNERFEVFFPERRPFFLENADDFNTPITLLFTRRIQDPSAGVRATGRLGNHRLGVLWIDDERPGDAIAEIDPADPRAGERARFAVARVSHLIGGSGAQVGFMYTDRSFAGGTNRVGGFDGRIPLDERWVTQFQGVWSETDTADGRIDDPAVNVSLNRNSRHLTLHSHAISIGRDFRTEAGFVPRTDIRDLHQEVSYRWRPEGRALVAFGPSVFVQRITDQSGVRLDRRAQASFEWEFRRRTSFEIEYVAGRERLRPQDLPPGSPSTAALDFEVDSLVVEASSSFVRWLEASVEVGSGRTINFVPVAGTDPTPADRLFVAGETSFRLGRRHRLSGRWLHTALEDAATGAEVFTNDIGRVRWDWQFTTRLSLRTIVQYDRTTANPALTRLERRESLNGDVLATWLLNPWTAVYLGYTGNWANLEIVDGPGGPEVERTEDGLLHDARQVFLKVSWLFGL